MELPPLISVGDFKKTTYIGFFCKSLRELCALCSNWFAAKGNKELGTDSSKNYLKRKAAVWSLSDQILGMMKVIQFEKQKAASKVASTAPGTSTLVTTPLAQGYGRERREFEEKKQQLLNTAKAGGKVDTKGGINLASLSYVSNGLGSLANQNFSRAALTPSEAALSRKNLANMDAPVDDPDFKALYQMLNSNFRQAIKGQRLPADRSLRAQA